MRSARGRLSVVEVRADGSHRGAVSSCWARALRAQKALRQFESDAEDRRRPARFRVGSGRVRRRGFRDSALSQLKLKGSHRQREGNPLMSSRPSGPGISQLPRVEPTADLGSTNEKRTRAASATTSPAFAAPRSPRARLFPLKQLQAQV